MEKGRRMIAVTLHDTPRGRPSSCQTRAERGGEKEHSSRAVYDHTTVKRERYHWGVPVVCSVKELALVA